MLNAALLFTFLPVASPVPSAPPAPAVTVFGRNKPSPAQMLSWIPGEVRCDGVAVEGGTIQRPLVTVGTIDPQWVRAPAYRFAIDERGRTHSIARDNSESEGMDPDTGPALAASHFPAGGRRENCRISYTPKFDPLASAPIADLIAYSIHPTGQKLPQEGWDRINGVGNCRDKPRLAPLLSGHPDFRKLKATPGTRDWSLVAYDTDADGRPVDVRIAHGTGNDELDAAAIEAIRVSRFAGGARTGCLYPYWRSAGKLRAPVPPAEESLRPADAVCPAKVEWARRPATYYPPAYRKRAIEGWAVVAFDTAPWGEVGNVRVLDAQPSSAFGQQAMNIVRSGRVAPSAQGASGCVETVKFMMSAGNPGGEVGDGPETD